VVSPALISTNSFQLTYYIMLIKGTFKDHLVTWVHDYVKAEHPASEAQKILDDIDRR